MSIVAASLDRVGIAASRSGSTESTDDDLVAALREGSTSEEVRAMLGLKVGNQRVLLHRGRARLRVLLGPGAVAAVGA